MSRAGCLEAAGKAKIRIIALHRMAKILGDTETLAALQTDKPQPEIRAIRDRGLAGFPKRRKPLPL